MLHRFHRPMNRLGGGSRLPRHLHTEGYATLVLEGGYEEAGEVGRWRVRPGQVLFHGPFSIHRNQSLERGARLVNLPLARETGVSSCGTIADPDLVARLAERDPRAAAEALLEGWREEVPLLDEAPDRLSQILRGPDALRIHDWAEA